MDAHDTKSLKKVIGVLGGTFDPPHLGHLDMARIVLESKKVDTVLLVPCYAHAFEKSPVSFDDRVEMCNLMAEDNSNIEVSEIERKMITPGRTLELLELLFDEYPHSEFRLVVGTDIYLERQKWHKFEQVEKLAPPIYLKRQSVDVDNLETLDAPREVSSTFLRDSIKKDDFKTGLIHPLVVKYIRTHNLYGEK